MRQAIMARAPRGGSPWGRNLRREPADPQAQPRAGVAMCEKAATLTHMADVYTQGANPGGRKLRRESRGAASAHTGASSMTIAAPETFSPEVAIPAYSWETWSQNGGEALTANADATTRARNDGKTRAETVFTAAHVPAIIHLASDPRIAIPELRTAMLQSFADAVDALVDENFTKNTAKLFKTLVKKSVFGAEMFEGAKVLVIRDADDIVDEKATRAHIEGLKIKNQSALRTHQTPDPTEDEEQAAARKALKKAMRAWRKIQKMEGKRQENACVAILREDIADEAKENLAKAEEAEEPAPGTDDISHDVEPTEEPTEEPTKKSTKKKKAKK